MSEITDLDAIQTALQNQFKKHIPPLQIKKNDAYVFEVAGTIEAMRGKQKVDAYYFGSIVPRSRDIRLYYFPIYTHAKKFEWISDELRKCLKGKSCFHIKKLTDSLEKELASMIKRGIELYQMDKLI
jgi:hypothetical protein